MDNKELLRESINAKINKIEKLNGGIQIYFGKEKIEITDYHDQDCCENVYADFDGINYYIDSIIGKLVKEIIIKGVEEMGILICFYFDYDKSEKVFIPCYNSQNGYYSDNLSLIITRGNTRKEIDIRDFKEDNLD
jgi:hypothetical protein